MKALRFCAAVGLGLSAALGPAYADGINDPVAAGRAIEKAKNYGAPILGCPVKEVEARAVQKGPIGAFDVWCCAPDESMKTIRMRNDGEGGEDQFEAKGYLSVPHARQCARVA
jgi:hypothetical protein